MSNQSYMPDPRYSQANEPTEPVAYPPQQQYRNDANNAPQLSYQNNVEPTQHQVERREEVYDDPNLRRSNARYWATAIIYFLLTVLEIILVLRFLFRFLGANQGNGFVMWLYSFSYPFVAPFKGIFTDPSLGYAHVFEVSTLIAMLIYALIAWGLVALSRIVFGPTLTDRRSVTMERQRRGM